MVDIATVVAGLGALVFLAHFFAWLFSFTAIPDGLLLLAIGLLLGPILKILSPEFFGDFGPVILTVTLVIMLFESGSRLQWAVLRESLRQTFALTIASFVFSAAAVSALVWAITDLSPLISIMVGTILGGTTSAVIIPLLDRLKFVGANARALLVVESALSDVLSIVITIALLQAYQTGAFAVGRVAGWITISFVYSALLGFVAGLVWSLLLSNVRHMRNSSFVTVAFLFLLFGFVEYLGMSGPITTLLFGLTLGNAGALNTYVSNKHRFLRWLIQPASLSKRERAFFSEIVFLLQTFFFVFVGLSISFTSSFALIVGAGVTVCLLLARLLSVRLTMRGRVPLDEARLMSILFPKGLAAAVLATLLLEAAVPGAEFVQHLIYAVILSSIVLTSLLAFVVSHTVKGYAGTTRGGDGAPGPVSVTAPQANQNLPS